MNYDIDEWLSIKDAAKMAGVSPQAIYKRLNTTLKPYVKLVENKKYLNIKGLEFVSVIDFNQRSTLIKPTVNNVDNDEIDRKIIKTIELLEKQLEVKDKQIETKDKQIQEINDRLNQALKISSQNNFLLAQEKENNNNKMLDDPGEEKRSFFQRLFKR